MKKYVTLLLSLVLLLTLFSCQKGENTTNPTPTDGTTPEVQETTEPKGTTTAPEDAIEPPDDADVETDPFQYYHNIIEAYGTAVRRFDLIDADDETLAKELELETVYYAEAFRNILESAYAFYPYGDKDEKTPAVERLNYFVYDERQDLNGDGHKELVLMTEDYRVLAIYSYIERPKVVWGETVLRDYAVLLDTFTPEEGCWIDSEGRIHVNALFSNSLYQSHAVYEIEQGGARLNLILEYGKGGNELIKIENGERVKIGQAEFDALDKQYGSYLAPDERAEATRTQSGLGRYGLFSKWQWEIPEAMYRPVLSGEKQVLVEKTGESIYLKDYVPAGGEVSLAKCDTLRYIYYDVDENDVIDVAIDCGSEKLCLTYHNGTVTLKSLSTQIWESIEERDFWYVYDICALGAPWREKVMSPQEIEAIASSVWGIEDGQGDGACGTYYIAYIDVAEEPDEDGYYLVTWREEAYSWCGYDDCPETDPNHRHLRDVRNYRHMLVHMQTGEYIDNARISPERAKRVAEDYWGLADGTVIHGKGRTFVVRMEISDGVGYGNELYSAYLRVECYSTHGFENGYPPLEVKDMDFVYIHRDDGGTYVYPYIEGK